MQTPFHPTLAPCWTSRKALKTWIAPDRTGPRRENAAVDTARAVQARCIFSWSTRASCTLLARSACVLWLAGDRPCSSRTMDLLHAELSLLRVQTATLRGGLMRGTTHRRRAVTPPLRLRLDLLYLRGGAFKKRVGKIRMSAVHESGPLIGSPATCARPPSPAPTPPTRPVAPNTSNHEWAQTVKGGETPPACAPPLSGVWAHRL